MSKKQPKATIRYSASGVTEGGMAAVIRRIFSSDAPQKVDIEVSLSGLNAPRAASEGFLILRELLLGSPGEVDLDADGDDEGDVDDGYSGEHPRSGGGWIA